MIEWKLVILEFVHLGSEIVHLGSEFVHLGSGNFHLGYIKKKNVVVFG